MAATISIIVYFLIPFLTFSTAKLPKEYQVDKTKWKNPSDHYTRISTTDNDENSYISNDDGDYNSEDLLNGWQQEEWLFAWITIAFVINALILVISFICFFFICRKRKPSVQQNELLEAEEIIHNANENISTELENTEDTEANVGDTGIEDNENLEVDNSEPDDIVDEKINTTPKIEFEDEYDIFGPIESDSEKEGETENKLPRTKFKPPSPFTSTSPLLPFDEEINAIPPSNIKVAEDKLKNNALDKTEITPILNNPDPGATISTDDDDDFFVIGKKDD